MSYELDNKDVLMTTLVLALEEALKHVPGHKVTVLRQWKPAFLERKPNVVISKSYDEEHYEIRLRVPPEPNVNRKFRLNE